LLVVVAAHSLISLAFLTSDEFFELKLQRKWVFQQTANCVHAGEPLNASGKRERLSGPEKCRVSNSVSYAANFGGLVRMMKTNSEEARNVFRKLRADDDTAHEFISFLHRNYPGEEESSYLATDWRKLASQLGIQLKAGVPLDSIIKAVRKADPNYMNRLRALEAQK
jgi:hypothetical protein